MVLSIFCHFFLDHPVFCTNRCSSIVVPAAISELAHSHAEWGRSSAAGTQPTTCCPVRSCRQPDLTTDT